MKVLIIEQEKTIQQSLLFFMERFNNCQVFSAGSAQEGVALFALNPFDIVLCGDHLPDGDGLEILKTLIQQNPNIISILMTAHGDELSKQDAIEVGITGYLEKPFDLQQLEEVIGTGNQLFNSERR